MADRPSDAELVAIYGDGYFAPSKYRDESTLRAESQRRLALLGRYVQPGEGRRVLDAGCAIGDFVSHAKADYEVFGVDLSAHAVDEARRRNPELGDRLRAGRLESLEFPDVAFDAICLWDVIEHLWDPVSVCRALMDRLRPGGVLLLSTPAADAPIARIMGRFWAFMTPPEHLSFFTRRSLDFLARDLLRGSLLSCRRMGKRANVGFVLYKIRRIAPFLMPEAVVRSFRWPGLARLAVYVPTGDVQYAVVKKPPV
ncbi:MAG: class I SAM-dependent methyltransferase [Planctomycetes bacterium]|nr:class I SAM-dependent methyltransferase [Planctomycetota bacterium]